MIKTTVYTLLFLLSVAHSFGQKKYIYEYPIASDHDYENEISHALCDSINATNNKLELSVKDRRGNAIEWTSVTISSKDTSVTSFVNREGKFVAPLIAGIYTISVNNIMYKSYKRTIQINSGYKMDVTLAQVPKLGGAYTVYSKKKLTKEKLKEIQNCLEQNNDTGKCRKNRKYYITITL